MRADERREVERFVAARTPALLRTAFLLTGHREAAQDLVQDALVRMHGRWGGLRAPEAAEAYLRKVMVSTAANQRRRRWHREVPTERLPEGGGEAPFDETDTRQVVLDALRGLSPAHRVVLVLRFYEDLSEAATADFLGCSVGTVKSRTSRALAQLRAADLGPRHSGRTR